MEHRRQPPLADLWMLPWRSGNAAADGARPVGKVTHSIMNRRYRCEVYETIGAPESIPGAATGPGRWVAHERISSLPHSSLLIKCIDLVREAEAP